MEQLLNSRLIPSLYKTRTFKYEENGEQVLQREMGGNLHTVLFFFSFPFFLFLFLNCFFLSFTFKCLTKYICDGITDFQSLITIEKDNVYILSMKHGHGYGHGTRQFSNNRTRTRQDTTMIIYIYTHTLKFLIKKYGSDFKFLPFQQV